MICSKNIYLTVTPKVFLCDAVVQYHFETPAKKNYNLNMDVTRIQ